MQICQASHDWHLLLSFAATICALLYLVAPLQSDRGVLSHGNDFLRLIGHGARGGQARYYT